MGTILGTLVIGLVVGAIAKLLMPGRDPGGCLITILLGIAGAFPAGLILYGIARARGATRPPAATWRSSLIVGGFLLLGGNGGVTVSEKYIDTGLAAVIVATVPIYIVLLSWASGSAPRPNVPVLLGLAGGFLGVGILMARSLHFSTNETRHPGVGMLILLFA